MRGPCRTRRHAVEFAVVVVVVALPMVACTGRSAPHTDTVGTTAPSEAPPAAPREVHPTRVALGGALPTATDLGWLPNGATPVRDSDLTDRLVVVGCSAAPRPVASNRASATNVAFDRDGERVAIITYYDTDSVDEASQFISGMRAFLRCPNQGAPVSVSLLPLATPTTCDDLLALRTRQPVSETIDAWCRVGNLVGSIRLYPQHDVAPTDAQGVATIDVVGVRLGALFA